MTTDPPAARRGSNEPPPVALDRGCQVWLMDPGDALPSHLELLTDAERRWSQTYRLAAARQRHTVAAALLKMVVAPHLGVDPREVRIGRDCPDCDRPHGRPRVAPDLHVSISHSGERVAVGVSAAGPVGVDIEQVVDGLDLEGMLPYTVSETELATFPPIGDGPARIEAFYRCWTRKESILKATGDGLRVPMNSVTLRSDSSGRCVANFAGRPELSTGARVYDLAVAAGYVGAITVLCATEVVVMEIDSAGI